MFMRKPTIPKIIITPPDDTSTTHKKNNSESNEKDEIWMELEDMSPNKKKSTNTENQNNHSNKEVKE